jgi:hypothetical protein
MTLAGLEKVERQLAELEGSHQDPAAPHVEMAWIGIVAVENAP